MLLDKAHGKGCPAGVPPSYRQRFHAKPDNALSVYVLLHLQRWHKLHRVQSGSVYPPIATRQNGGCPVPQWMPRG